MIIHFFILPFLEKPLETAPIVTQMGATLALSPLNWSGGEQRGRGRGARCVARSISGMEMRQTVLPLLPGPHPPSQQCDRS